MNITFRQLKLFLALAQTGSVSAAAKAMHVSQPTASMQLKDITQAVGMPLYDVISKKIYLTDVGRELAKTAAAMLGTWDVFKQGIDSAKGLTRGKLKVAVVSTAKYFMPRLIGAFCKKHPEIDVALEILNRDGVVQRMRENLDDLYIMSQPPADMDLADETFMANPLVLIAATSDPMAKKAMIPLDALASRRFILREKGSGTRMAADQYFASNNFLPNVRMELGSNEAIKESVAGELGIGVVSRHALHGFQKEHGVAIVDVAGFPILSNWHIVHPSRKKLSPIAAAFKVHLLQEVARRKKN
jgi:DNA-binding transcriptional LysR family regulator